MLLATGPINEPTETLGVVIAMGTSVASGCAGLVNPMEAYQKANNALKDLGREMRADAVISVNYQLRSAVSRSCGSNGRQVFEVYASGTAVKFLIR
jgi:uncharacterized protein YbjQ (UPF0145 family)